MSYLSNCIHNVCLEEGQHSLAEMLALIIYLIILKNTHTYTHGHACSHLSHQWQTIIFYAKHRIHKKLWTCCGYQFTFPL